MKPRKLTWVVVCGGLVMVLSVTGLFGWLAGVVVAGALVLAIPLSVTRWRQERNLVRSIWRALATR